MRTIHGSSPTTPIWRRFRPRDGGHRKLKRQPCQYKPPAVVLRRLRLALIRLALDLSSRHTHAGNAEVRQYYRAPPTIRSDRPSRLLLIAKTSYFPALKDCTLSRGKYQIKPKHEPSSNASNRSPDPYDARITKAHTSRLEVRTRAYHT